MRMNRIFDTDPGRFPAYNCKRAKTSMLNRLLGISAILAACAVAFGQSGVHRSRPGSSDFGANLTINVFQFDDTGSPTIDSVVKLSESFASPSDETAYLKVKQNLQDVSLRHNRSVGLTPGQDFLDAVLLGPEYMVIKVTPTELQRGHLKLDLQVRYANENVLNVKSVDIDNFETVLLRGGKGMFGVKYCIGSGGRQETAPLERTLLLSVMAGIVPSGELHNRPGVLSHPVDEYGAALTLKEGDRFTPPVVLDRVVPKFETGRKIQGAVTLMGVVTAEGKMTNVQVQHSLDSEIDQRAMEAFREYKFSPGMLNAKPIGATYQEEITFARDLTPWEIEEQKLEDKKKNDNKNKSKSPTQRRRPWPWP
jgi:TonB family protein